MVKNNQPFFSQDYVENLLKEIKNGDNKTLKSRRNKKYIDGKFLYKDYVSVASQNVKPIENLLKIIENDTLFFDENTVKFLVADCAIKLLLQRKNLKNFSKELVMQQNSQQMI